MCAGERRTKGAIPTNIWSINLSTITIIIIIISQHEQRRNIFVFCHSSCGCFAVVGGMKNLRVSLVAFVVFGLCRRRRRRCCCLCNWKNIYTTRTEIRWNWKSREREQERERKRTSKTVKEGEKKWNERKKKLCSYWKFCCCWRGEEKQNGTMNYYYYLGVFVVLCCVVLCCCSYRLQNYYYDSGCRKTMEKLAKQAIIFWSINYCCNWFVVVVVAILLSSLKTQPTTSWMEWNGNFAFTIEWKRVERRKEKEKKNWNKMKWWELVSISWCNFHSFLLSIFVFGYFSPSSSSTAVCSTTEKKDEKYRKRSSFRSLVRVCLCVCVFNFHSKFCFILDVVVFVRMVDI